MVDVEGLRGLVKRMRQSAKRCSSRPETMTEWAAAYAITDLLAQHEADRARVEELEAGIRNIINAADSFCDEEGYDVAGQVKIRARALLQEKPDAD